MKMHYVVLFLAIFCIQIANAGEVTVNGEPTGVSSEDAREAFERLGEAMKEATELAAPGEKVVEVKAPDVSDLGHEPEPEDTGFDY